MLHLQQVRTLLLVQLLPPLCLTHVLVLALLHEGEAEVLDESECLLVVSVHMPDIVDNFGFFDYFSFDLLRVNVTQLITARLCCEWLHQIEISEIHRRVTIIPVPSTSRGQVIAFYRLLAVFHEGSTLQAGLLPRTQLSTCILLIELEFFFHCLELVLELLVELCLACFCIFL